MADKLTQIIVEGLTRAAAEPQGMLLYSSKTEMGLFAPLSSNKPAAKRCVDEGLLEAVNVATPGRTVRELHRITEKGTQFLVDHACPKQVLEDFVRILESRQSLAEEMLATTRQLCEGIASLKSTLGAVLPQVVATKTPDLVGTVRIRGSVSTPHGATGTMSAVAVATRTDIASAILTYLADWSSATGAGPDCPLPELYRGLSNISPDLRIGEFHDYLRQLHEANRIYLHPWTGPLYSLPEPTLALLVGHNVAYYASYRR